MRSGWLQRLRNAPASAARLALFCYLLTGAAVPPGHMAAPLASGTVFHLCPGDARSAHILERVARAAASAQQTPHHPSHHSSHHHGAHALDATQAVAAGAVAHKHPADGVSAEPVCGFTAGAAAAPVAAAGEGYSPADSGVRIAIVYVPWSRVSAPWLRPPARSPPVVIPLTA